ncbi:SusC/RagA family TonB-linked outer membrane protein [Chitinophaga niabensis]|uniref:SusC/RagA family TonB-linked outer membrane protein n=1 Tax=Chitinophaga niabensis TaxID=536979 RepID=UPI0031BA96D0
MRLTFTACVRRVILQVVPLFLCTILLANEGQDGEKITLFEKAIPLKTVFKKITYQTGIKFVYSNRLVDDEQKVNVSVKNASLEEVMQQVFYGRKFELQRTSPKSVVIVVHEKTVSTNEVKEAIPSRKGAESAFFDVTGIVTDTVGGAIPGATVMVRGTNKATATNGDGRFYLQDIKQDMMLLVSSIGFQTRQIKISNQGDLSIKLSVAVNNLDESVITAYGSTTQRDNVGSITVIKGADIEALPNRSFDRSLQGMVPGLQITKGTGQPGGGVSNMVLRGVATGADVSYGSTARNPLIVIDGVPVSQDNFQSSVGQNETPITNPLAQFNPSDIETISVLKDAVAIALYGSKASNGVILVTTKKGKVGKTVFSFRHQTDIASRLKGNIRTLNQEEYLTLLYDTYKSTDAILWTDQAILADLKSKFPVRPDGSFYPAPDWYSELFSNRAATVSNQLSMSGGSEKSTFYLNLEYSKQDGIIKKTGYDRKSMRFNFENRPTSWFKLGINSAFSYNTQTATGAGEDAITLSPLLPVRLADGNYQFVYTQGANSILPNPAAITEYNFNRNVAYHGLSKLSGEVRFLKYLTFTSNVGIDFMLTESKEKNDPKFFVVTTPRIAERDIRRTGLINTNMLRFDKTLFSDHTLNLIAGQEAQINTEKGLGASAVGTAETLSYYDQMSSPGYTRDQISSFTSKQTLLSLFGQVNYGYKNKYFLSSSIRRDASSKFGDQQQWGTYWSAGAGWVATAEPSIKRALPWVNYLKLRGSVGMVGNSGALSALVRFDKLNRYRYQNRDVVVPSGLGNPDVRWEKTFNWDAGMELKLLRERVSITADVYERITSDLLYQVNLPSIAGSTSIIDNIGDINNKGIELSLSAAIIKSKAFRFNLGATWGSNRNILLKANVPLSTLSDGILGNEEGRNFNSFYLPIWAGVNPADGKPQWLDNAGKPTSNYSKAKREFVGKPQPDGFGAVTPSFSYKGFNLSAQLYYLYGAQTYDLSLNYSLLTDGANPYINPGKQALNYWKAPGDMATNPRRQLNNTDLGNLISTRYLFYSGYVRLSNVTLSYTFNKRILDPLHLSNLNLFVQGNNLGIITNFSGPDPDNVSVGGSTRFEYPNERTFSIGLNVSFQ